MAAKADGKEVTVLSANYTHYRFGAAMLNVIPADLARVAKRYRRLYDMGLHGPDIFFYNPLLRKKYGRPAPYYHNQSGAEFFGRVCRIIRMNASEPMTAYLYGVLCHYCLDSVVHPFIKQISTTNGEHLSMETEFDRYLLELDGKTDPHTCDISGHIKLTRQECQAVAACYPGVTAQEVAASVKNMAFVIRTLAVRDGVRRSVLEGAIRTAGETASSILMSHGPNERFQHLNEQFMTFYREAEERYPRMLLKLNAHLTYNAPLGGDFTAEFG